MMTDKETDAFFIKTLNLIYQDLQECKEYVKNIHTPEYDEINEDYDDSLAELKNILKEVKGIDDLAEQDYDIVDDVYYYLASWADNFVVSHEPSQNEKDMAEYNKIEEILNLFMDDDGSAEEDDEFEELDKLNGADDE